MKRIAACAACVLLLCALCGYAMALPTFSPYIFWNSTHSTHTADVGEAGMRFGGQAYPARPLENRRAVDFEQTAAAFAENIQRGAVVPVSREPLALLFAGAPPLSVEWYDHVIDAQGMDVYDSPRAPIPVDWVAGITYVFMAEPPDGLPASDEMMTWRGVQIVMEWPGQAVEYDVVIGPLRLPPLPLQPMLRNEQ